MADAPASIASFSSWIFAGAGMLLVVAWLFRRHDEKRMFSQSTLENDFGPACGPAPREPGQRKDHSTVPAPLL